jgi:hypothetical protein
VAVAGSRGSGSCAVSNELKWWRACLPRNRRPPFVWSGVGRFSCASCRPFRGRGWKRAAQHARGGISGRASPRGRPASFCANPPRVATRRPYASGEAGGACFSRPIFCHFLPSATTRPPASRAIQGNHRLLHTALAAHVLGGVALRPHGPPAATTVTADTEPRWLGWTYLETTPEALAARQLDQPGDHVPAASRTHRLCHP